MNNPLQFLKLSDTRENVLRFINLSSIELYIVIVGRYVLDVISLLKQSFYNRKTPICELSFRLGKCIDVGLYVGYFDIHVSIRQMFHETPRAYYGLQTSTKTSTYFTKRFVQQTALPLFITRNLSAPDKRPKTDKYRSPRPIYPAKRRSTASRLA